MSDTMRDLSLADLMADLEPTDRARQEYARLRESLARVEREREAERQRAEAAEKDRAAAMADFNKYHGLWVQAEQRAEAAEASVAAMKQHVKAYAEVRDKATAEAEQAEQRAERLAEENARLVIARDVAREDAEAWRYRLENNIGYAPAENRSVDLNMARTRLAALASPGDGTSREQGNG